MKFLCLRALPVPMCVSSECSGFLLHPRTTQIRLNGQSKLPVGANVHANGVIDWRPVQGVHRFLPEVSWDLLQLPLRTTLDKQHRKWMYVWMYGWIDVLLEVQNHSQHYMKTSPSLSFDTASLQKSMSFLGLIILHYQICLKSYPVMMVTEYPVCDFLKTQRIRE